MRNFYLWEKSIQMFPSPFLLLTATEATMVEMPKGMHRMEVEMQPMLSEEAFFEFCERNHPLRIEKNKNGKIIIMAPVGFEGGQFEGEIYGKLFMWHEELGKGWITNPSTAFRLPNQSIHAPDASWISDEKIAPLTDDERKRFPPVVPDFIIEIRSESDQLSTLKNKMEKVWMANGVRLAWLIDPKEKAVYIYRENGEQEKVSGFENKLSGEDICPGFEFDLSLLVI